MSEISLKTESHLKRINQLPQVQANRFVPGHIAHNKVNRIPVKCFCCGKDLLVKPYQIRRWKNHFCSLECHLKGKEGPVTDRAVALYKTGKTIKEIALILGHTPGTTASLLYTRNKKARFSTRWGKGKTSVKNRLPKHCELCGYTRVVEVCHVNPVRLGGQYSIDNCLSLCPNCHHLFDHDLLTETEKSKLRECYGSRN